MLKTIGSLIKKQVPILKKRSIAKGFFATDALLVKNLPSEIVALNSLDREIANFLLSTGLHRGDIYPSQVTMATRFKKSHVHVNRVIKKLERIGFISIKHRWNNSNVYTINPVILLMDNVHRLHSYLPALKKILLLLCISASIASFGRNVNLPNIYKDIRKKYYIKKAPLHREYMKAQERPRSAAPEIIRNLPFELDIAQKVFLCAFPPAALEHAREKLSYANIKSLSSPWAYYVSQVKEYCLWEDIQPDYKWMDTLREKYKLAKAPNLSEAQFISEEDNLQKEESRKLVVPANAPGLPSIKQQIFDLTKKQYIQTKKQYAEEPKNLSPYKPSLAHTIPLVNEDILRLRFQRDACIKNMTFLQTPGHENPQALEIFQEKLARIESQLSRQ